MRCFFNTLMVSRAKSDLLRARRQQAVERQIVEGQRHLELGGSAARGAKKQLQERHAGRQIGHRTAALMATIRNVPHLHFSRLRSIHAVFS